MKEVEVRLPGDDAELKCIADIGVGGGARNDIFIRFHLPLPISNTI